MTLVAVLAAASSISALSVMPNSWTAFIPLASEAVAISANDERVPLATGDVGQTVPGTRVLSSAPNAELLAAQQRDWLNAGTIPLASHPFGGMTRTALLDIDVMTLDNGASLAGWSYWWRFVWPRDAAFVAVALAYTDHHDDALHVLQFLQDVQEEDGRFHARYLSDGSGDVPDDRGIQLDGSGWVLWATWEVAASMPDDERVEFLAQLRPMIARATDVSLELISNPRSLPPASQDYWERDEEELTLGTAAPLLAGLLAASDIHQELGDHGRARDARDGAARLEGAIHDEFGPDYPRYASGDARDTSVGFMLPPFTRTVDPDVLDAWHQAADEMRRPAGGLAPGAGWQRDGVSWTPETAIFALNAAAMGIPEPAEHWLSWLDQHRTAAGALPEKVLSDGRPAQVAPLTLTAAIVVIAAAELEQLYCESRTAVPAAERAGRTCPQDG